MKHFKTLLTLILLLSAVSASAQYTQQRPNVEYMLKVEAGFNANLGVNFASYDDQNTINRDIKGSGTNLNRQEQFIGLNVINGVNISQDFFLGFGIGGGACLPLGYSDPMSLMSIMAHGFIDMDFRPVADTWAPMIGIRLGGSLLMNDNNYGTTIGPYAEVYAGLNWFYDHALQQMNRNYHSLYVELGIVYEQQALFIPIRLGWRL